MALLQTHAQLNQKQADQIKKRITALIDTVMTRFEELDIEGVVPYYSPDFVAFAPDGRKYSMQQVKESYSKLFSATASCKWTTYNLDFIVITKDIAVIAVDA
ncbi:MAG: nuclear transport factor 2 family protein [Marinilabiliales bacterium]|nr:nuclear transport factor 2 family protein [Marinilabiliales bacterium]